MMNMRPFSTAAQSRPTSLATCLQALGILLLCATLSACGFQLRGANGSLQMPFASLYIAVDQRSPLGLELSRNIRATGGTQVVKSAQEAEATLEILAESTDKTVLSLNSAGRPREYALSHSMKFRVVDKLGRELLMPTELNLRRSLSFNETQVLAKEAEAELLYKDMQTDLVQQVMRRLAAINKTW